MKLKTSLILLLTIFIFASRAVNAQDTTQNNLLRANQLFKELLPDEKITVDSDGIRIGEYTFLTFSDETPELPIVSIRKENDHYYLHLCCVTVEELENPETLEGHTTRLATTAYPLTATQLPLSQELKTLIESIRSGE